MLTFFNESHRFCDGVSRRSFLRIGAGGVAGITLANLLAHEARAGAGSSNKALINIYLSGGPSHTDMFDLKPNAAVEFRGEFSPIKTNVPGMEICEHMPRLAQMADKFAVVRSIVGSVDDHTYHHTLSGYRRNDLDSVGGRPPVGSVLAKLQGRPQDEAPAFVSFMGDVSPGFLGPVYRAYQPDGAGRENLRQQRDVPTERIKNRRDLLTALDRLRRDADIRGEMGALDAFTRKAAEVVSSGKLAEALDLDKEDPKVRERYTSKGYDRRGETERFLVARRLIEAGVRCVTLNWGGWDTHGDNFNQLRRMLPQLDQGLAALVMDLYDRGLDRDVTVIMWGEFGRTPRINGGAGRDHWSPVMACFMAGGGMKLGQMIGTTDKVGAEAKDRPVHIREVIATLYHNLGISAKDTTILDPQGRPQYLVDGRDPIRELV